MKTESSRDTNSGNIASDWRWGGGEGEINGKEQQQKEGTEFGDETPLAVDLDHPNQQASKNEPHRRLQRFLQPTLAQNSHSFDSTLPLRGSP